MAVETMVARQLTYFAAREKDSERRCDIEAGMAKLLGARVAWANADNALQVRGGNGYAEEYKISRVLCDARNLNNFEGAAEIQAQGIATGLLSGRNRRLACSARLIQGRRRRPTRSGSSSTLDQTAFPQIEKDHR